MKLAATIILTGCLVLAGCCFHNPEKDQLILDVPSILMEAPANFVMFQPPEVETSPVVDH